VSYFNFDTPPLPAHIVPDDGVTLDTGWFNLSILPDPAVWPTLRWRIGDNSVPDGTTRIRDYDNPGPPTPTTEVQVWTNVLNDYTDPAAPPFLCWGMNGWDAGPGNSWYYHLDTGWTINNSSPLTPPDFAIVDRYPNNDFPPGWAWSAVTAIKPGVAAPKPEWPYTPSVLNAGEGGWGVTRLRGR
jgi:hypothetical protein